MTVCMIADVVNALLTSRRRAHRTRNCCHRLGWYQAIIMHQSSICQLTSCLSPAGEVALTMSPPSSRAKPTALPGLGSSLNLLEHEPHRYRTALHRAASTGIHCMQQPRSTASVRHHHNQNYINGNECGSGPNRVPPASSPLPPLSACSYLTAFL